jgi:ABC-type uncharacterized transport system substrate-binding protein
VGQNVTIEYRWAEQQIDRLPAMAADLVKRHVTVIAAVTIPIVFETGSDPVRLGLVVNLNRPGGNVTGVANLIVEVAPKRLELLHELLSTANVMALLVNPADRAQRQLELAQQKNEEWLRERMLQFIEDTIPVTVEFVNERLNEENLKLREEIGLLRADLNLEQALRRGNGVVAELTKRASKNAV